MHTQIQTLQAVVADREDVTGVFELTLKCVVSAALTKAELAKMSTEQLREILGGLAENLFQEISISGAIIDTDLLEVRDERDIGIEVKMLRLHQCQDCEGVWDDDELHDIRDLGMRVGVGEPMPSGQCPSCRALCHPLVVHEETMFEHHVTLDGATINDVDDPEVVLEGKFGEDLDEMAAQQFELGSLIGDGAIDVDLERRTIKIQPAL